MMASKCSPKLPVVSVIVVALLLLDNQLYAASAASGGVMGGYSFGGGGKSPFSSSSGRSSSSRGVRGRYSSYGDERFWRYSSPPPPSCNSSSNLRLFSFEPIFSKNATPDQSFVLWALDVGLSFVIRSVIIVPVLCFIYMLIQNLLEEKTSVFQLQIGLSAKAGSVQRDLNEIARKASTSNARGWTYILKETTSLLLRRPDYYLYGYSSVKRHSSTRKAERQFKRLSEKERKKFDVESLVNVNGVRRVRAIVPKAEKVNKDCIVVTILVAGNDDKLNLPTISTSDDVQVALESLREIDSSKTLAVKVLWTPQDEADSLPVEELLEKYPYFTKLWLLA